MAKLFRSEEMTYMETIVPAEAARSFAFQLAALGCVQLTDVCLFKFYAKCLPILSTAVPLTLPPPQVSSAKICFNSSSWNVPCLADECGDERLSATLHQGYCARSGD